MPAALHVDPSAAPVDVLPLDAAGLAAPQTERRREQYDGLELLARYLAEHSPLVDGTQCRPPHDRLARQLDALRHVPHPQLVASQRPPVELPEGLERLLGGAGALEPVDPRLELLEAYPLQLATRPSRREVAPDGALVALERCSAETPRAVLHVLGDGNLEPHIGLQIPVRPRPTRGVPYWDFRHVSK